MPGPVVRKDPPLLHRHGRILKVDHPLLLLRSTVRGATFTLAKRAARARGSRPRARARAARPAPRVQRPRRRAPRRRRPSRGRAAGGRVPQAPRRVERPPTCAPRLAAGGDQFPGLGRRAASKGRRATVQTALLALRRRWLREPYGTPRGAPDHRGRLDALRGVVFLWCNCWFCESVTVGARASRWDLVFFFARTAQPYGRVRTPDTDQTTRRRVSRRSTSETAKPDLLAICGQCQRADLGGRQICVVNQVVK